MAVEYILQYWHPGNIYNTHFTKYFNGVCTIFAVGNSSCGNVMFSQASVILSTGRGGVHPPWADTTPRQTPSPTQDSHCSGRYASYWNAFMFSINLLSLIHEHVEDTKFQAVSSLRFIYTEQKRTRKLILSLISVVVQCEH